jgi:cell division protein FtsN
VSARDYKKAQRRRADLGRLKEFGAGILVGGAVAAAAFIYTQQGDTPVAESLKPEPRISKPAAEDVSETEDETEQYDFYEMLPNFEVVVPERDREVKRNLPAARIERPGIYVLQAGSYRNLADAERVRAKLEMHGVVAKVQRVAVDNDVWHRVRIGPIDELPDLNRVREKLQAAEIDALVIRVGD